MNIAILGFGTVGSGVFELLNNQKGLHVTKVLSLDKTEEIKDIYTNSIDDILQDDSIDCIVEVIGGIEPAHTYICQALSAKKHVVSANKAVIAKYLKEFLTLAKQNNVSFLFEAAVGGGVPWIESLYKAKRVDDITHFHGIFNGTGNFILYQMETFQKDFDDVLKQAQALGYAEADPSADIDGYDVQNKVVISSNVAFDTSITITDFPCYSLRTITLDDILYFKSHGYILRYIGESTLYDNEYEAFVMLNLCKNNSLEANVSSNNNIMSLHGASIGELQFYGQGAGKLPTANAIVQDIINIQENKLAIPCNLDASYNYVAIQKNVFVIRTTQKIQHLLIDKAEENYYYTKAISAKELEEILSTFDDPSRLVVKVADFEVAS